MPQTAHKPIIFRCARYTVCLVGAVGLTACGLGTTNAQSITKDFISAMQKQDWESACNLLSHDFIHRHMNDEAEYCVQYMKQWHGNTDTFDGMFVPDQKEQKDNDETLVNVQLADGAREQAHVVDEDGALKLSRYPGQGYAAR